MIYRVNIPGTGDVIAALNGSECIIVYRHPPSFIVLCLLLSGPHSGKECILQETDLVPIEEPADA